MRATTCKQTNLRVGHGPRIDWLCPAKRNAGARVPRWHVGWKQSWHDGGHTFPQRVNARIGQVMPVVVVVVVAHCYMTAVEEQHSGRTSLRQGSAEEGSENAHAVWHSVEMTWLSFAHNQHTLHQHDTTAVIHPPSSAQRCSQGNVPYLLTCLAPSLFLLVGGFDALLRLFKCFSVNVFRAQFGQAIPTRTHASGRFRDI